MSNSRVQCAAEDWGEVSKGEVTGDEDRGLSGMGERVDHTRPFKETMVRTWYGMALAGEGWSGAIT